MENAAESASRFAGYGIKADLARLHSVPPAGMLCLYLSFCPEGKASRAEAVSALKALAGAENADAAVVETARIEGFVACDDGFVTLKRGAGRPLVQKQRLPAARRAIALQALGLDGDKKADLTAAFLARVFALDLRADAFTRNEVRFAILSQVLARVIPGFAATPMKRTRRFDMDGLSRACYLALAGIEKGTVLQADTNLLRAVLGAPVKGGAGLAAAITRLAGQLASNAAQQSPDGDTPAQHQPNGIGAFASQIRDLAKGLETKPYKGRVAIAQVYDTGVARGLIHETLDEFKARLAEAARESLLDLERYDIAGPFDAGLKERSRTRLGRDERHFIVNRWN